MQDIDNSVHKENLHIQLNLYKEKYGKNHLDEVSLFNYKIFASELEKLGAGNNIDDEEDELIRLMHIRFLFGEDKDFFDYTQVDFNEIYDDLYDYHKDQEEKFFDEEEATNTQYTEYTGNQDY